MNYTPTSGAGNHPVTGTIARASSALHASSSGSDTVVANLRITFTQLSCTPVLAVINTTISCSATVIDTDPAGTKLNPMGTVNFTKDGSPGGSCMLAASPTYTDRSSCSVPVTFTSSTPTVFIIVANYVGNSVHKPSSSEPLPIVFYDPNGGFVTGGGYILHSPTGMLPTGVAGKNNYGFVAKYKKNTSIAEGETEFQCKTCPGGMNFHSSSYDWLVVSGNRAQYQGSGTVNGAGNYGFKVTVIDGGQNDTFRIKIWDKNNGDALVYDNEPAASDSSSPITPAAGGNIVVHNK